MYCLQHTCFFDSNNLCNNEKWLPTIFQIFIISKKFRGWLSCWILFCEIVAWKIHAHEEFLYWCDSFDEGQLLVSPNANGQHQYEWRKERQTDTPIIVLCVSFCFYTRIFLIFTCVCAKKITSFLRSVEISLWLTGSSVRPRPDLSFFLFSYLVSSLPRSGKWQVASKYVHTR